EPWSPVFLGGIRELLELGARLVGHDESTEAGRVGRALLSDCLVVAGDEFRASRLPAKARATAPRVVVHAALGRYLLDALEVNAAHGAPRILQARGRGHPAVACPVPCG